MSARLTLQRRDGTEGLLIGGTDLVVLPLGRRDSRRTWTVLSYGDDSTDWLWRAGLNAVRFQRRSDLMAAVAAHHASDPIPGPMTDAGDPLVRAAAGDYRSRCATFRVTRSNPADRRHSISRWQISRTGPDGRRWTVARVGTLAEAQRHIHTHRQSLT